MFNFGNNKSNNDSLEPFKKMLLPDFAALDAADKKKSGRNKILKEILKWIKILIYIFFFSMGLYGCGQSLGEYWIQTSTTIGSGLEIGFAPGFTGDYLFDLIANPSGQMLYPFSDFTMAYGPFYGIFVWPFAQLLLHFMYATRMWVAGLNAFVGIFLILLIIKLITFPISIKSNFATEKMTEVQGRVSEINAKYKNVTDMQGRQKKQMEMQDLYRKNNVKPFASFEQIFITLPIFLIVYRVVTIVRPLKASFLFGIWDLSLSPISQIFSSFTNGGWTYIFFVGLVVPAQVLSQKLPQRWVKSRNKNASTVGVANNKQLKKTKMIQNVFTIFMAVITVTTATGVGVYWFFNSLLSLLQSYIVHVIILKRRESGAGARSKLSKLGL